MSDWAFQGGQAFGQDNRTTKAPGRPDFTDPIVGRIEQMAQNQGLHDNTLDFVGMGLFGKMKKSVDIMKANRRNRGSIPDEPITPYGGNSNGMLSDKLHRDLWYKEQARKVGKDYQIPGQMTDNGMGAQGMAIASNIMDDPRAIFGMGLGSTAYRHNNE